MRAMNALACVGLGIGGGAVAAQVFNHNFHYEVFGEGLPAFTSYELVDQGGNCIDALPYENNPPKPVPAECTPFVKVLELVREAEDGMVDNFTATNFSHPLNRAIAESAHSDTVIEYVLQGAGVVGVFGAVALIAPINRRRNKSGAIGPRA